MEVTDINVSFARCVKQLGFYTRMSLLRDLRRFARCVKQLGFYTVEFDIPYDVRFARCVKQLGFYTKMSE